MTLNSKKSVKYSRVKYKRNLKLGATNLVNSFMINSLFMVTKWLKKMIHQIFN